MAELEHTASQRDVEVRVALTRIEHQLAELTAANARGSGAAADERWKKLDELEARVARIQAPSPAPPRPRRHEPQPDQVYAVAVTGNPAKGPADALVTVVRAGEYACPFCERVRDTLDQLAATYPKDVRIVHKSFLVHPTVATDAANAGCAAHRQGRYWAMDTLLWEKAFKTRQFDKAHLEDLAHEAGLDLARFRADVSGPCPADVKADQTELMRFGVAATPSFFINGRFLAGALPLEQFKALVDEELAKARDRVKNGTRRKDYYDTWVVKRGLTQLASPSADPATP